MKLLVLVLTLLVSTSLVQARKRNNFHKFAHRERIIPMAGMKDSGANCDIDPQEAVCSGTSKNHWYYSTSDGLCYQYIKTCSGNANAFATQTDCKNQCVPKPSDCELSKDEGKCKDKDKKKRFYYDTKNRICRDFKSCPNVDGNNFETQDICENTCVFKKLAQNVDCFADPKTNCRVKTDAYTFDVEKNKCVKIKACTDDSKNLFVTSDQCNSFCRPLKLIDEIQRDEKCTKDQKSPIVCANSPNDQEYYFDKTEMRCVSYKKDKNGNKMCADLRNIRPNEKDKANSFKEEIECVKACLPKEMTRKDVKPECVAPPSQVSCGNGEAKSVKDKYFFNADTQSCEMYSDCGDNSKSTNSFDTYADCKKGCLDN